MKGDTNSFRHSSVGFYPHVDPSPAYPPFSFWISWSIFAVAKAVAVAVFLVSLVAPFYYPSLIYLRSLEYEDRLIFTIMISLAHTVPYILYNGSFGLMDYFGLLQSHKLPRPEYTKPSRWLIIRALIQAIFSQLITGPAGAYFGFKLMEDLGLGFPLLDDPLPSYSTMCFSFFLAYEFNEWGFYWSHRFFHIPFLYSLIHKKHHEFVGTMGIGAEFANPVEYLIANILPTLGGILLARGHPLCVFVWLSVRLQQTYEVHSGYCFRDTFWEKIGLTHGMWAAHHDYHHTKNRGNFGTFHCDWLFGTMDSYVVDGGFKVYGIDLPSPSEK